MKDLMIDLETMGTRVNAPVVAIGACFFDLETGKIGRTFEAALDLSLALKYGRLDGDTLKWWLDQGDEARRKISRGRTDPLKGFAAFCDFAASGGEDIRPWGNGASFDISMIEVSIARTIERAAPWKFWNVRDCRTLKHMAEVMGLKYPGERKGVHHSALDDAVFQAEWVSYYWQRITGKSAAAAPIADGIEDLLG